MFRVLIVEDEDIIRNGIVHTIDWLSMNCVVVGDARNGQEGLQMIRTLAPDIVMVDIKMPQMNGLEMIQEASNDCFFKSIVLTSYSEFAFAKAAMDLRVSDYLLKPLDENELRQVVMRICKELAEHSHYSMIASKMNIGKIAGLEEWNIFNNAHSASSTYVGEAVKKIVNSYQEKISIDTIAKELGISKSYLSRKFKEQFGKTFLEALNQFRIQQSIKILAEGKYRVYEVAFMCGFSEYKYFHSVFRQYTNMSPSQFLQNLEHAAIHNINLE